MLIDSEKQIPIQKSKSDIFSQGIFHVPYIPSVNSLYMFSEGRKIMDPEMVKQRYNVFNQLGTAGHSPTEIPQDCKLTLELGIYFASSINKRDVDNTNKWVIDTIADFYKFNDSRIYNLSIYKRLLVNSDKELVYYRIRKANLTTDNNAINFNLLT